MLQKIIHFSICLIVLSLPLYLIRLKIGWIPTNLLELMIGALFIIWLVSRIRINSGQLKKVNFFFPVFLIFLGVTLATLFSIDVITSAGIWRSWFIAPLIFFIVVVSSIKTREQVKNILTALILSGTGVALVAFIYWLNNNLIIVIYWTYSYGAWLGIAVALIFLALSLRGRLKRPKQFPLVFYLTSFFLLLVILAFSWQIPGPKFQGFLDFSYPSWQSRLIIWQSAGTIIKDHSLIGIGPGMFQKYYLDYQFMLEPYLEWAVPQPHNLFLAFWLQTGLIGLIGFIWLLFKFFRSDTPQKTLKKLSFILIAAMIYILVHGLVDTTYWKNDLSIIFWLLIALSYTNDRLSY
jgi:hypothetical protein